MSTILFSRSATCFFSPRGCCTIVTYSPMIALPSASISGLNPNGASSAAVARTATSAKSRSSSARKKRSGSSGSNVTSRGRPSTPSWKLNSITLALAVSASGSTWWLVSSSAGETSEPVPKPTSRPIASRIRTRPTARAAATPASR